jgi:hypothetical protein
MTVIRLSDDIGFHYDSDGKFYTIHNPLAGERLIVINLSDIPRALNKVGPIWSKMKHDFHDVAETCQMQFISVETLDKKNEDCIEEVLVWMKETCKSAFGLSTFLCREYFWFASLADYTAFKLRWL